MFTNCLKLSHLCDQRCKDSNINAINSRKISVHSVEIVWTQTPIDVVRKPSYYAHWNVPCRGFCFGSILSGHLVVIVGLKIILRYKGRYASISVIETLADTFELKSDVKNLISELEEQFFSRRKLEFPVQTKRWWVQPNFTKRLSKV